LSIGAWFVQGLAGIEADQEAPGFARVRMSPALVGDVRWAEAAFDSAHGRVESRWRHADGGIAIEVVVPPNVSADITLPTGDPARVTESGVPLAAAPGIVLDRVTADRLVLRVGSGRYAFTVR